MIFIIVDSNGVIDPDTGYYETHVYAQAIAEKWNIDCNCDEFYVVELTANSVQN